MVGIMKLVKCITITAFTWVLCFQGPLATTIYLPQPNIQTKPPATSTDNHSITAEDVLENYNEGEIDDPLEPFNRLMFMINDFADIIVINPLAMIYKTFLPDFVQTGVRNTLSNLMEPVRFVNSALQGKIDDAFETLGRFIVNSTLGIVGLFDVASEIGLEKHEEDFGQTLESWGFESGPYLVLPLLGPSSLRDALGQGVDTFGDPVNLVLRANDKKEYIYIRWSAEVLSRRAYYSDEIDSLKETSIDFYATVRSLYAQRRAHLNRDGKPSSSEGPLPLTYDEAFE
ncbi:MAG: ABC transporter [Alphaproteobacteria bacterium]|nr:MAG: ABC transporter [Alphaproteobacteria bacterium]